MDILTILTIAIAVVAMAICVAFVGWLVVNLWRERPRSRRELRAFDAAHKDCY
jgi:uncharacterized protein YjiS (DUF1127 family)